MLVRQSPRTRISPDKNPAQWPPKSPFQALLSSPSGRKKWQDHHSTNRERSVSPSPVKRSSRALQDSMNMRGEDDKGEDEGEDDLSDEEARAALELARIEAKLKLDGIRRKKRMVNAEGGGGGGGGSVRSSSPRKTARSAIEVPVSPTKPLLQQTEHVSPARKRLGLHVPAKAVEVSLKRAREGTTAATTSVREEAPRGKSFNERLRETVSLAGEREAKAERVEKGRSRGFGSAFVQTMEREEKARESTRSTKETGSSRAGSTRSSNRKTMDASTEHETARPRRTEAAAATRPASSKPVAGSTRSTYTSEDIRSRTDKSFRRPTLPLPPNTNTTSPPPPDPEPTPSSSYDSYSELHLSKRHIPHATIARALEGKEIYPLPRLLKEVKSPSYDPPDIDTDYVVFAVLASKSSPYDQKSRNRTSDENEAQDDANAPRNKFMVLKLCDLNWEIDCFLFGTAFDQFWKLVPGTLLAILNPDILPPKGSAREGGRFSLKLGSSEDSVMEVGVARDLKWCSSVKKDGRKCEEWVDGRSSEICEFHLNLLVERQRKGRMEVNTMWRGHGNGDPKDRAKSRSREEGGWNMQMNRQKGVTQSREYGTLYSVKSTANLLDAEDTDRLSEWNEGEKSRQRLAAKEKERDLQRQLEKLTSNNESVGAEYMRAVKTGAGRSDASSTSRAGDAAARERERLFEKPKASELGLLGNKAEGARMSPAKDRKRHFGVGAANTNAGGKDAMGWGGYAKWGLLDKQSKNGDGKGEMEKGQTKLNVPGPTTTRPSAVRARSQDGSVSPSKKRARFMLAEKGLRTPGRESGGVELKTNDGNGYDEDDDDDLDIVQ
ncbi:hypothetical protein LTR97_007045 [Elasticomyces elasticus]|uniref:Zinc finger Mcm10/DnaG-type domain-containing protein n=1 Tax=Elasticomyces elasticus TaxID=574655 RepID=A0AAN7W940_9PEZI|nr:hypothetical protein LTR97_007045 [Elasticomyces elasticus]